ncbi:MAG: LPS export ABC transporter periplasmic protein LptC [Gemmatimonadales bacterium]|nr:LPS export ABC transporter periplasmic protein LptC [Gemmatimonadales bacterium]
MRAALFGLGLIVFAAACRPAGIRVTQSAPVADSADQKMLGMSTNMLDEGVRTGYVTAETAFVYQSAQRMDLRRLKVTFFENGKQSSVLTADQGDYHLNLGSLDARGHVKVISTDGRRLDTPHLIYDKSSLQLRSDTTFVYESPTERLTGNRFTSDLEFRNVIVDQPKARQRGPGFPLTEK